MPSVHNHAWERATGLNLMLWSVYCTWNKILWTSRVDSYSDIAWVLSVKLGWIALTLHEICHFLQISPSIILWSYCYGNHHYQMHFYWHVVRWNHLLYPHASLLVAQALTCIIHQWHALISKGCRWYRVIICQQTCLHFTLSFHWVSGELRMLKEAGIWHGRADA